MIKPEHLRQFLAVSDHSSLVEAAEVLHRSPSAVSMTLKLIEEHLGQPLFEGDRKQVLTPLGKFVQHRASKVIAEYDNALLEIERFSQGKIGNVSVAAVPSVATLLLPRVMVKLYSQYPDVRVDIRDIDSGEVARTIKEGRADFGIASLSRHSSELATTLLMEEVFMCILPKDHPLVEKGGVLNWDDLSRYPFIANPLVDQVKLPELEQLSNNAILRIRNMTSLVAFVREGFGITLLPRMAALLVPDLMAMPIQSRALNRKLFLLHCADRSLSPAASALSLLVAEALKEEHMHE